MEIDILIDKLTDCLIDRKTGEILETEYRQREKPIRKIEYKGWKFDWKLTEENEYIIYELFLKNDNIVQGRVALKNESGIIDVDIVESAPHNLGKDGSYIGVGGHLFAIACQVSLELGYDGVVVFTSKSNLVEYYKKELKAVEIMPRRMVIFEEEAEILINKYIRK